MADGFFLRRLYNIRRLDIIPPVKRAFVIILDGVGVGELPDAGDYHDEGSNTLGNLARACGGLHLPVLESLGLGNIIHIQGVAPRANPRGAYGKMAEASAGKDSTTGHWELMGVVLKRPFPTYPKGFPRDIIQEFEKRIGHLTLGNYPASGTDIIRDLGVEHIASHRPIVYTSADSVFQIACHVDVFSVDELYRFCAIAREILQGEHAVARVIARPFAGQAPEFYRTHDRRDFSLPPPQPTLLDLALTQGFEVTVIGKVDNLFANRGFSRSFHSILNRDCVDYVFNAMSTMDQGLVVANLVQFDMDWGHRNDTVGFKAGLERVDADIGRIIEASDNNDLICITADHGNDPTTPSTDHSREHVPLLVFHRRAVAANLGTRTSFSDLGATIAEYLGVPGLAHGKSFAGEMRLPC